MRDEPAARELARARWRLLGDVLAKRHQSANYTLGTESRRSHPGFGLITELGVSAARRADLARLSERAVDWTASRVSEKHQVVLTSSQRPQEISLAQLDPHTRVDNTGNVCVWPSEKVLAFLCTQLLTREPELLQQRRVCELGAGMSGLAALTLAMPRTPALSPSEVVITDGNSLCVDSLRTNIQANQQEFTCPVTATQLIWDRDASGLPDGIDGGFDLVIAADCLFFEHVHADLAHTLSLLLAPSSNACALLLAPLRGGSAMRFAALIEQTPSLQLSIRHEEWYDDAITSAHRRLSLDPSYQPDVHYPHLFRVTRRRADE